ncbi:MAG: B12-binding domain-containing radical SAM protein [Candidatus Omnitrophota bacterium]
MMPHVGFYILDVCSSEKVREDIELTAILTFLKSASVEYRTIRISTETENVIRESMENINPEWVYIHVRDIVLIPGLVHLLTFLKKKESLIFVGGGSAIAIHASKILKSFHPIDAIIRSPEIEKVLLNLHTLRKNSQDWKKCSGIAYRSASAKSKVIHTAYPPRSENLNHLSHTFFYDQYDSYDQCVAEKDWYSIISSSGCEYQCQYCGFWIPYSIGYKPGHSRWIKKEESVFLDEIEFLVSKGIRNFLFHCHQFFGSHEHMDYAFNLAQQIIKRKLNIQFKFSAKPSLINRNKSSLPLLKKAGLKSIYIGIDSGLPRFHRLYQTGSTVEDCVAALELLHQEGIDFESQFLFFDPYLTIEEIGDNLAFLKRISVYFSHLPLPYCAYLDSRIFNSALVLRFGMPIIDRLRTDNLLVEYPRFSRHPAAKFMNSRTMVVYSIYRALNSVFLKKLRSIFYDNTLVERFDFIRLLPLTIMEEIVASVERDESNPPDIRNQVTKIIQCLYRMFEPSVKDIVSDFEKYRNLDQIFEINYELENIV